LYTAFISEYKAPRRLRLTDGSVSIGRASSARWDFDVVAGSVGISLKELEVFEILRRD